MLSTPPSASGAAQDVTPENGIDRFWKDCAFSSPAQIGGYKLFKISLLSLSDEALDVLASSMEHHYLEPAKFRMGRGGDVLAKELEARLPDRADNSNAKKDRGGDLGELLGIEWLRKEANGTWEVCCTLRWKESIRPRRGEDIVAIRWTASPVGLLKGEAKAADSVGGTTIANARNRLDQDGGWPSPFTIHFLAEKLAKDGRDTEATRLFEERFVITPRPRDQGCTHLLFLFSGDDPLTRIPTHGSVATGVVHDQVAAILVYPDYEALRDRVHNRAIELARSKGNT